MSKVGVPNVGVTQPILLNDVHARLNPTRVAELVLPRSLAETIAAVQRAAATGVPVSICGGRHAMGGQQLAEGALQVDMSRLDRLVEFCPGQRLVTVQAGMQWPGLLAALRGRQDSGLRHVERTRESGVGRLTFRGVDIDGPYKAAHYRY